MNAPAPEQIVSRELEHIRCRHAATHAKPARRIRLIVGQWPDWITGRDREADADWNERVEP